MHSLDKQLLYNRQFDILLITTLTFHAGRDTTDDDDGVGHLHLVGQISEVSQLTLADITAQHGEIAVATTIFNYYVIVLAFLYGE